MNPRYNWSGDERTLIGYEAVTTLTVSDLPLDQVGGILAQSVSAGINNIQSISYLSSKYDESYQEALSLAIAAARTKAEGMAQAAGCQLGEISALNEQSTYSEARYTDNALAGKNKHESRIHGYRKRNHHAWRTGGRGFRHCGIRPAARQRRTING